MKIYTAKDNKDGNCVRLLRGEMDQPTIYGDDPVAQGQKFEALGFRWLHVVDLNGAIEGHSVNSAAIEKLVAASNLPIQLGGGIRDMKTVDFWLGKGVRRVVLGTAALLNPNFAKEACRVFPQQIAIGIDARDGMVATSGWTANSDTRALDLALRYEEAGAAAIIYTDINRDGALTGINIEATIDLAFALTTPVIASGGLASMQDLIALKDYDNASLDGVIIGRALYDGRIDAAKAIKIFED